MLAYDAQEGDDVTFIHNLGRLRWTILVSFQNCT